MGIGKTKEAAYTLPDVLLKPAAVFGGLTQETDEPRRGTGWLCYVGRPTQRFDDNGRAVPASLDRVFLVFVNDEWVAYNWYWYAADPKQPDLPEGHEDRFHKRLI